MLISVKEVVSALELVALGRRQEGSDQLVGGVDVV